MGVTVFNDKYVRVTRAWNKEETQIYVPIKKSLKAAIKEAEQIDRNLAERQKAFLLRQEMTGDRFFHEDGTIVGLRIVTRHRDGRKPSNEITLRVKVPEREKPFFSNVSIDKHGFDQAFKLAVDKICEWNELDSRSPIRERMLEAGSLHRKELSSAAKSAKPAKAGKAKAGKTAKPSKPVKAAKPVKATKPAAKPVKAVKGGKPAKVVAKPAKVVKTTKAAAKPAKPVKAVKPAKAAKAPAKPVKASKAAPAKPAKAAKSQKAAAKSAKAAPKGKKAKDDEIYKGLMQEVKKFQGKKKNTIRG